MPSPTLASEALAAGRPGIASSFRFHRRRGPLCGRGYCFQCVVDAPGGAVLACEASGTHRRRRPDPLRPLGRIAETLPPWFYERRFVRNQAVNRLALDAVRHASGAARLALAAAGRVAPRRFEELRTQTVVVGDAGSPPQGAYVLDAARGEIVLGVYPDRVLGVLRDESLVALRFDRLVLATGAYDRLPPIPGNDLPGTLGLDAAIRYAAAGGLRPGVRVAAWTPPDRCGAVERLVDRHRLRLVWMSEHAPEALSGRGRIERLHAEQPIPCDVFITAVEQPAIELALQAGARGELTSGELPILVVNAIPEWLELRGSAAARTSGVPDVPAADAAFVCLCEDVRARDVRACVAGGFRHAELVKRRTGAMTGPCQGKLCAASVLSVLRAAGVPARPTTARPLALPVTLGALAAHA
jgi:bacterioferritin-associated ferredoxin